MFNEFKHCKRSLNECLDDESVWETLLRGYSRIVDTWLCKWTWSLLVDGHCFVSSARNCLAFLLRALHSCLIESNRRTSLSFSQLYSFIFQCWTISKNFQYTFLSFLLSLLRKWRSRFRKWPGYVSINCLFYNNLIDRSINLSEKLFKIWNSNYSKFAFVIFWISKNS